MFSRKKSVSLSAKTVIETSRECHNQTPQSTLTDRFFLSFIHLQVKWYTEEEFNIDKKHWRFEHVWKAHLTVIEQLCTRRVKWKKTLDLRYHLNRWRVIRKHGKKQTIRRTNSYPVQTCLKHNSHLSWDQQMLRASTMEVLQTHYFIIDNIIYIYAVTM